MRVELPGVGSYLYHEVVSADPATRARWRAGVGILERERAGHSRQAETARSDGGTSESPTLQQPQYTTQQRQGATVLECCNEDEE